MMANLRAQSKSFLVRSTGGGGPYFPSPHCYRDCFNYYYAPSPSSSSFRRCKSNKISSRVPKELLGEISPNQMAKVIQGPSLILNTGQYRPSPSLMMLSGLRSLSFWTRWNDTTKTNQIAYQDPTLTRIVSQLESRVDIIREEYMSKRHLISSDYDAGSQGGEHASSSLHTGEWDWHSYMLKGKVQGHFCQHFPITTDIIQTVVGNDLFEGTPFGFAFFSRLGPQACIQPHVAPMNFRLRIHLPLIVPKEKQEEEGSDNDDEGEDTIPIGIRVGSTIQEWREGTALVLDDSFEHEVWNTTDQERILLLLDIWHPDVSPIERERILAMFVHATSQGWLKE